MKALEFYYNNNKTQLRSNRDHDFTYSLLYWFKKKVENRQKGREVIVFMGKVLGGSCSIFCLSSLLVLFFFPFLYSLLFCLFLSLAFLSSSINGPVPLVFSSQAHAISFIALAIKSALWTGLGSQTLLKVLEHILCARLSLYIGKLVFGSWKTSVL